jgi:hypothetical protein
MISLYCHKPRLINRIKLYKIKIELEIGASPSELSLCVRENIEIPCKKPVRLPEFHA